MRTQIQGKEKTGELVELGKVFEDVSELLDVGFSIFGTSGKIQGRKSEGKGLIGLIDDLAKFTEKSKTYHKTVNLGKKGVIDFHVNSRPIKGSYMTKQRSSLRINKPKGKTAPPRATMPPTAASIKERDPIVDVFEEEDHVNVMAELPGVEENDVKLKIENQLLTIIANTSERKYYKEVKLPTFVEKSLVKSKYRNGVLEVKLRKAKDLR
jgi:HSP20 family molecular chaperone IbpA